MTTTSTPDPRSVAEQAVRDLLRALIDCPDLPSLRVADAEGRVACLLLVWPAAGPMPTAAAERARRSGGGRAECKAQIVEAVRAANRSLTRNEVLRALRSAGRDYGPGTVAKALADLTATGELINSRDKRGYRLPGWGRVHPSLFS